MVFSSAFFRHLKQKSILLLFLWTINLELALFWRTCSTDNITNMPQYESTSFLSATFLIQKLKPPFLSSDTFLLSVHIKTRGKMLISILLHYLPQPIVFQNISIRSCKLCVQMSYWFHKTAGIKNINETKGNKKRVPQPASKHLLSCFIYMFSVLLSFPFQASFSSWAIIWRVQ